MELTLERVLGMDLPVSCDKNTLTSTSPLTGGRQHFVHMLPLPTEHICESFAHSTTANTTTTEGKGDVLFPPRIRETPPVAWREAHRMSGYAECRIHFYDSRLVEY